MVARSFFSGCGWFTPRSTMDDRRAEKLLLSLFLALLVPVSFCETDPNDLDVLKQFRNGLLNPEVLKWPENDDDPCGTPWPNIYCTGHKVSQIQVRRLGLQGSLPGNFNQLSMLSNLGLQENNLSGPLPTFNGMKNLRYAFLDFNNFSSIPADFFTGLDNLEVLALDNNVLNGSTGWMFPPELGNSAQLTNLTCRSCNLVGPLPEFLGTMSSLTVLLLSNNRLSGEIPASFGLMILKMLWLNNQDGDGMSGSIDVVTTMTSLNSLWLHGNQFGGTIPASIGNLTLLQDLNLNENQFVGLIPDTLANMNLKNLNLNNNKLMGPIPEFKASTVSYSSNSFCQSNPGIPCAPQVMALIEFLGEMNYPLRFASSWTGNDPCLEPWFGLICHNKKISLISLPKFNLNGTLSPSVAKLDSLTQIRLPNNNLSGQIPANWTALQSLQLLDLTGNNISPPLPAFSQSVKVAINNNPLFSSNSSTSVPGSGGSSPNGTPSPTSGSDSNPTEAVKVDSRRSKASVLVSIVAPVVGVVFVALLAIPLSIYFWKKKKRPSQAPSSFVIHPRDPSYSDNTVKVVVANNTTGSTSSVTGSGSGSINSSGIGESHVIEAGNLVISVQVLRNVTKNFSPANEIGRGGFGVVYKGELDDGTKIAVKRMESGVISSKALDEFRAEICVLSKVRHRHLVSLLGYAIQGNEKILVYEYMPQGALSQHLFNWKSFNLEPLSWKRRLNIALDVARGMEYLHNLAHQSFIHRDLKSSNILLGDDFKAKVADFGLVKLAPDGEKSVVTRLAGTFGYLAPEYAVTGKITTKADVFSFGVVLMELITGLMAIDEKRTEESQYLASWFWHIKSNREKLISAIDPALDNKEDIFESISIIAELAGHCTVREPNQRPDMGHAVNVLASLVEKWKPFDNETDEFSGIDYSLPLNQMVKDWQEMEGKDQSSIDLEDSKGSIPARPTGFAESFTSVDGR